MNKQILSLLALLLALMTACKENEMMGYDPQGKVYFFERTYISATEQVVSEKNFSFALQNSVLMADTFRIKVKLMGYLSDRDRTFRAKVVADSSTAVEGTHYKLLEGAMRAGEYISYLPVVLYRTADTRQTPVKILLELVDSPDLLPGNKEYQRFKLAWGDILLKPDHWPDYFFGVYSKNKYQFAIDNLALTDWPTTARVTTEKEEGVYTISELQSFANRLNEAYVKYRNEHGPIYVDDNSVTKEEIYYGQK